MRLRSVTRPPSGVYLTALDKQVDRRLQQHVAVGQHAQVHRAQVADELDLLGFGRRLDHAERLFQHLVERAGLLADLDHAGLDAGQVQQVLDQPLQAVGLAVDDAEELLAGLLVLGLAVGQQLDVGLDAGQRAPSFRG